MSNKKASSKPNKGITLIRKSNELIEARYKFDIWETRFFLSVLSKLRREDDDFKVYRVRYQEIAREFGLKTHQSYDMLREGAKKLMNKNFYVKYEENGKPREVMYHIMRKIDYSILGKKENRDESQEYIDLTIEQEMKPFLLQLQESFTIYDMRNITKLGAYAIRIYELLKQYETIGERTLEFDEMKRMFELEKEYPRFPNFQQKIIQPAINDINKYTDLTITEVEKIKEGRKVVALCFYFKRKRQEGIDKLRGAKLKPQAPLLDAPPQYSEPQKANTPVIELVEYPQTDADRLFALFYERVVENLGVTPMVFADLVKNYTEEQMSQAIRVTSRAKMNNLIKTNVSGYFVQALKNGYTDQKEQQDKKKTKEESVKNTKADKEKTDAFNRVEVGQKEEKQQKQKNLFAQQRAIFDKLIATDAAFHKDLTQLIKENNMMKNNYDFEKSILDNMQKPMIAGIVMGIAVKLRQKDFE